MTIPSKNGKSSRFYFDSIDMIVQLPESKKQQIIKLGINLKVLFLDLIRFVKK